MKNMGKFLHNYNSGRKVGNEREKLYDESRHDEGVKSLQ